MPERDMESLGVMGKGAGGGQEILPPPSSPPPPPPISENEFILTISFSSFLKMSLSSRLAFLHF